MKPGLDRLLSFLRAAAAVDGQRVDAQPDGTFVVKDADQNVVSQLTLDREVARARANVDLLGLDHPLVATLLARWQQLSPERIGLSVSGTEAPGVMTWWLVETRGSAGEQRAHVVPLGVSADGKRSAQLERLGGKLFARSHGNELENRDGLLHEKVEPLLERELQHRELIPAGGSYAAKLIGWVEVGAT